MKHTTNTQPLTMEDILERLREWKENTDIDIKSSWIEDNERQTAIRQST